VDSLQDELVSIVAQARGKQWLIVRLGGKHDPRGQKGGWKFFKFKNFSEHAAYLDLYVINFQSE